MTDTLEKLEDYLNMMHNTYTELEKKYKDIRTCKVAFRAKRMEIETIMQLIDELEGE